MRVDSPVFLNCPPGYLEALERATQQVTPEELDLVFNGPTCASMSQIHKKSCTTFRAAQELKAASGVPDQLVVGARVTDRRGCSFAAVLNDVRTPSARTANLMARAARHIAVARRLRSSLSQDERQTGAVEVDAIFVEQGALLHAEGRAKEERQRAALARAVMRLIETRNRLHKRDPDQIVRLWNALVDGRWSLVDSVDSDGKRFLIARKNTPELRGPTALSPDERHLAALFAFGHSTKLVAYELGLSPSTVSARFATVLRKLKVDSRAEFGRLFGVQHTWR